MHKTYNTNFNFCDSHMKIITWIQKSPYLLMAQYSTTYKIHDWGLLAQKVDTKKLGKTWLCAHYLPVQVGEVPL